MGLVLNPYAYRIGHTRSWADSWFLFSAEYVEFLHSSMFLKVFIHYVLYKFYPTRFSSWLLSHTEILFFNNCMYIWLYIYEASGKYKLTKYIKLFKFGSFKNLRMKTFWLKKSLFHRNPVATSIFNFLNIFGSHIEKYDVITNYVLIEEDRNKIDYLRSKYGYKWLGKEEIIILRSALSLLKRSANYYALNEFLILTKALFFFPYKANVVNESRIGGARIFLFFMSYIMFIIKSWSYYRSKKLAFVSKFIFVFLRWTSYWLFYRPFVTYISKFLEYLCSFFGYTPIVRVSIITNFTLSAFFIARYIMTAIKNGFNYLDIVFPIRKTLNRFMQLKVFDSFVNRNTSLRREYTKAAFVSSKRRVSLIILVIYFIKSRLFVNDLNIYSNIFNKNVYLKSSYFNNLLGYSNIFYRNKFVKFFSSKKRFVFKRFYFKNSLFFVNNKEKLFRNSQKILFFIIFLKIFKFVRFKRKKRYKKFIKSNVVDFVKKVSKRRYKYYNKKKPVRKIPYSEILFKKRFRLLNIVINKFVLFLKIKRLIFVYTRILLLFLWSMNFMKQVLTRKYKKTFSRYTKYKLSIKSNHVYRTKYISRKKLLFYRKYHFSELLSDDIISVLKSLVDDSRKKKRFINKRAFRPGIDYSKILSNMIIGKHYDDKRLSVRVPSELLIYKYRGNINLKGLKNNKILLNNFYIDYIMTDIYSSFFFSSKNINLDNNVLFYSILLRLYKYFYILFSEKVNIKNFRFDNIIFFIKFVIYYYRDLHVTNNLFIKIKYLIKSLDNVMFLILYKNKNSLQIGVFNKRKYAMFTFINKCCDLFISNAAYLSGFFYYFFYLLKHLSLNYLSIVSVNDPNLLKLFNLIDFYWYYGSYSSKRSSLKKFKNFFFKFKSIINIILIVLKLLFNTKFKINDDLFSYFYDSFFMFLPINIDIKFIHYFDYYLPLFIYLNKNFYKDAVVNRSVYFFSFKHYILFFDNFKFIEKFFHCFFINNFIDNKFPVIISSYFYYMNELVDSSKRIFGLTVEFISNKLLSYSDKIIRVKARDNVKSFLYGFKFHFVGRFTRKQQSASMWFRQGFLPVSTMNAEVDYGLFTIPLKFSACTVKIWLYRGVYVPKRLITF